MKYQPNIYDPTNCPPDPQRTYLGTDGRLLVGFPIVVLLLTLVAWAGFGTLTKGPSQTATSPDAATTRVVADAR